MLTRLVLTNHQTWRSLDMPLGSFTVVLGPSGSGKTSIVRALLAFVECAAGTGRITQGESSSLMTLEVDGRVLTWRKSTSVNEYAIDGYSMPKVGRQLPDAVSEVLNLPIVEGDYLSFSEQFEPPFSVFLTPTTLFKSVSGVSKAYTVQGALEACNRDVRRLTSEVRVLEDKQSVLDADDSIASLKTYIPAGQKYLRDITSGSSMLLSTRADLLKVKQDRVPPPEEPILLSARIPSPDKEIRLLKDLYSIDRVDPPDPLLDVSHSRLSILQRAISYYRELDDLRTNLEDLRMTLGELEASLESLPSVTSCPTCGQPILEST